jgi:hypothetical protein
MSELSNLLLEVQSSLVAPKNQRNNFGNYNYRSQEDILEAVKPLLKDRGLTLIITDEVKSVGEYTYIESNAVLSFKGESTNARACAGIAEQKGMSIAQSFGASSSYARKYALNGLFLIDDVKDDDAGYKQSKAKPQSSKGLPKSKPVLNRNSSNWGSACNSIKAKEVTPEQAASKYDISEKDYSYLCEVYRLGVEK